MKRIIKTAASLFLAATLITTSVPANFSIDADAAGKLSTKITYEADGTAILTITASEWENEIRYTTDGSVPTQESQLYTAPVAIDEKTTVRIAEYNEDDEKIKGIKKTVMPKIAKVTFKVRHDHAEKKAYVTLECDTLGAKIYYTTDGTKPDTDSKLYLGEIEVTEKTKIRVRAYCSGYKTTTTHSKTVEYKKPYDDGGYADVIRNPGSDNNDDSYAEVIKNPTEDEEKPAEPVKEEPEEEKEEPEEEKEEEKDEDDDEEKKTVVEKDPEESTVSEKVDYKVTYMADSGRSYVTFLPAKASNVIRYTTDGSAVTKDSKKYTSRIRFDEPGIIRAKEYTSSGKLVATLKVKIKLKCAAVQFICTGIGNSTRTIEMSTATEDATIYYTTNGTMPTTENSYKYTGPAILGEYVDIRAIAVKDGYVKSNVTIDITTDIPLQIKDFDPNDPVFGEVAYYINRYRKRNAATQLILDPELTKLANIRAQELAVRMDHTRPNGFDYTNIFAEYEYECYNTYEVISGRKQTFEQFIDEIYANDVINKELFTSLRGFTRIGIGYYKFGDIEYRVILVAQPRY